MNISAVNSYQAQNRNKNIGQYRSQITSKNTGQNTSFKAYKATELDNLAINNVIKHKLSWLEESLTSRKIIEFVEELFGAKDSRTEDLKRLESFCYSDNYYCYIPRIQEEQIKALPVDEQRKEIVRLVEHSETVSPRDVNNQSKLYNGKTIEAEREKEKIKVTEEMFDLILQPKNLKDI